MKIKLLILLCFLVLFFAGCSTELPDQIPDSFYFEVSWGFVYSYNSKTCELEAGYNIDLDVECKTQLILSDEELNEIYQLIRDNKLDRRTGEINTKKYDCVPLQIVLLRFYIDNQEYMIKLMNTNIYEDYRNYIAGKKQSKVIRQIIFDYIINKDEYKNLPENQLYFD